MHSVVAMLIVGVLGAAAEDVVVTTTLGRLRGSRVSTGPSTYLDTFLGVPFAKPPVGSLRFARTQPAEPWVGTRDAKNFGPACPQQQQLPRFTTSEDCLTLNIYTHCSADCQAVPVMMWVHGGGFTQGSGMEVNGTELAMRGVVVVTVNYRLDILGFLSTGDDSCPGNYGLLDVIQALKWIKENIASFHGNPDDVTIFGESAGGALTSQLRISPLTKGLIKKAIMESGVSVTPWGKSSPAISLSRSQALATKVGCPTDNGTAALVSCLKDQPLDTLMAAAAAVRASGNFFGPVVETQFGVLPKPPEQLIQEGSGADIVSIRGTNRDEMAMEFKLRANPQYNLQTAETEVMSSAATNFPRGPQEAGRALFKEYVQTIENPTSQQLATGVSQLQSDLAFNYPTIHETRLVVSNQSAARQYVYQFSFLSPSSTMSEVPHAAEIPFVFGEPFGGQSKWTDADRRVSNDVMTMWTNLAKYGDPTPQGVSNITWGAYYEATQFYLRFQETPSLDNHLNQQRMDLLKSLYERFGA
ncbi:acetylcholinesterase-like [Pomacea canaliculata]|uniref:acetylcholinesterase-like n=1 Tax=Pomacea canaliculata TaxID=400727 RepID=UPI000D72D7C3|nr:acetylcholinesterase-like [Pomacea canaliculata]